MRISDGVQTCALPICATWRGTLGQRELAGVHFQQGDEIRIEGERSNVILDGEIFEAMGGKPRSEEHTSELQSLMRISYAVFCLKKKKQTKELTTTTSKNENHTIHYAHTRNTQDKYLL